MSWIKKAWNRFLQLFRKTEEENPSETLIAAENKDSATVEPLEPVAPEIVASEPVAPEVVAPESVAPEVIAPVASEVPSLNAASVLGYLQELASGDSELTIAGWLASLAENPEKCHLAFDFKLNSDSRICVLRDLEKVPENMCFVGDLHGDTLALAGVLAEIDKSSPDAVIVFLGDLFDRHKFGISVVMQVLSLIKNRPGKIFWIAGNHDVGLSFDGEKFISDCDPSDFANSLNASPEWKEFGIALCAFMQKLPRALFLPDGLLCTHGGVPHEDCLALLTCEADFSQPDVLSDFTWNRIHFTASRKQVNRMTRGSELGYQNITDFCRKASEILNIPVKRIVCGHQHPDKKEKGYELVKNPEIPCLILNTSLFSENMFKPGWITPYTAQYRKGQLPEIFPIRISQTDAAAFYQKKKSVVNTPKTSCVSSVPDEKTTELQDS